MYTLNNLTQKEKEIIYNQNQYIPLTECARYSYNHSFYDDLLQTGRIALWEAIGRWDIDKSNGGAIQTYLTRCVRSAVLTAFIKETGRLSYITGNDYNIIKYIYRNRNKMTQNEIYNLCVKEISKNISYDTFNYLYDRVSGFTSLNNPDIDDPDSYYGLKAGDNVQDVVERGMVVDYIRDVIKNMPRVSDKTIDIYLCWFNDQLGDRVLSFGEIGKRFGNISKQRVMQIINDTNKKIRKHFEVDGNDEKIKNRRGKSSSKRIRIGK